jgi:hippurate hydrolase
VVTVGVIRAGTKANIIPDKAEIVLNVRALSPRAMARALASIRRIAEAECVAGGIEQPPSIRVFDRASPLINDEALGATVRAAHEDVLGSRAVRPLVPFMGSEDFSEYGLPDGRYPGPPVPYYFWLWGGPADASADPAGDGGGPLRRGVAANHSSRFAPIAEPTLRTGTQLLTSAALAFLPPAPGGTSGAGHMDSPPTPPTCGS